jgi:hypothetical protein
VIAALLAITACDSDVSAIWPRKTFSSSEWKSTPQFQRFVFAKDLLDGKLEGLTRAEVVDRLGAPSSQYSNWMHYVVKESDSGNNSVVFVFIRFDEKGRVSETGLGMD